jgi:hypothetical protein
VETTLSYAHGFYGLIADGWEIADFAAPWPRGPVPHDALEVELIVGFFESERRGRPPGRRTSSTRTANATSRRSARFTRAEPSPSLRVSRTRKWSACS